MKYFYVEREILTEMETLSSRLPQRGERFNLEALESLSDSFD